MIKAKKGLLIALFAAMMVFAFGATSAFALSYDDYDWSDDYSKVTVAGAQYDTVREAVVDGNATEGFTFSGFIYAYIDVSGMTDSVAADICEAAGITVPTGMSAKDALESAVWTYYYDLDNSVVNMPATMKQGDFAAYWDATGEEWIEDSVQLKMSVPDYVDNYDAKMKKIAAYVDMNEWVAGNWKFDLNAPEGYEVGLTTDQSFNLATIPDTDEAWMGIKGSVPVKAITVKAAKASAKNAKFYKDSVNDNNLIDTTSVHFDYNGNMHTVVMGEMTGYTVSWSIMNRATGKYETVLSPSITDVDVDGNALKVKAQVTSASDASDTASFNFNLYVDSADAPAFAFDEDGNAGAYKYAVDGPTYDPTTFIVVEPYEYGGPRYAQKDRANKQAAEANKETLMAFFNEVYQIDAKATKADPNTVKLEITGKDLSDWTDADWKAFDKKYEQLAANFGAEWFYTDTSADEAIVFINSSFVTPEIEFTNTPTAVTYKAKALKKKAKSFTVTATCNTGAAVSYKLINAPAKISIDKTTGKITLKKGLKKGTYKIKVKAFVTTPYFSEYYGVESKGIAETQAITVKVKK